MHNKAMEMAKFAMNDACTKGYDNMTSQDWDDFKDCVETAKNAIECDYYYRLVERMKKDEEEEKREDKYFLEMLKEENKDEYKRMREEYGEDEGERRFYDAWRYKNGRFAPKGRGTRRGYDGMPLITPEMYNPEMMRDMDRMDGRMYYSGGNSGSSGGMNGNSSGGSNRGYSDGYNDGDRAGYQRGYEEGEMSGRRNSGSQSRFDAAKRGYQETKQNHKGNSPEDKQMTMKEAEKFVNVILDELEEALEDASPEVKNMVKSKTVSKMQKM